MGDTGGNMVEDAETGGALTPGMVARRADAAEGIVRFSVHDQIGRQNDGAGGVQRRR